MNKRRIVAFFLAFIGSFILLSFQNFRQNYINTINKSGGKNSKPAKEQALDLYRRLIGTTPSSNDDLYLEMISLINSGQRQIAANKAADHKNFYNITVRNFAGRMSGKEESSLATLNDFIATIIGSVRDERDARELLTASYFYVGKNAHVGSYDYLNNIVKSNTHYDQLDNADLKDQLEIEASQMIIAPGTSSTLIPLDDAAGLLSTRTFMSSHADAGTNRRMIEYIFRIFECTPINLWASTANPDSHVGRDIGRFPIQEYNNKCKGCHTGMDGMRPATAYYDFFVENEVNKTGYIKYKNTYTRDPDGLDVPEDQSLIPYKFRRGAEIFPLGYKVTDNEWVSYADKNSFGWNTPTTGQGLNQLGQMIAYSDGFPRCMARRVFATACGYDLDPNLNSGVIQKLAADFKNNNYQLKSLFIKAALRPECLGVEGDE